MNSGSRPESERGFLRFFQSASGGPVFVGFWWGGLAVDDVTSTRVLLEPHRAGDAAALNALYGRYTPRVLAVVRARLGAELRQRVQSLNPLRRCWTA